MSEPPPLWIAFASGDIDDPCNQGATETYVVLTWLPFWLSLDRAAKDDYLDRWDASPAWRDEIAARYDQDGFDAEEDAGESAAWPAQHRPVSSGPIRRRWFRRG